MAMRWWQFLTIQGAAFFSICLAFAFVYWSMDGIHGARPGSFADAFYFSVHTLGTIGYGSMTPRGDAANLLVCLQSYVGFMSIALMSGLAFAKFSVPQTRVMFSKTMIVNRRDGVRVLQFRLANARGNQIVEARVTLTMARNQFTSEGESFRRLLRLPLTVSETPVFALSFLATHLIDESSPLHGLDRQQLLDSSAEFIVTLTGIDDTLSQMVQARHAYEAEDLEWDRRFVDTISTDENHLPVLDLTRFHDTEPLQVASSSQ